MYMANYHHERNHQGLGNALLAGEPQEKPARFEKVLQAPARAIGVKRINGGMIRPFVIRGHKRSMGHPLSLSGEGLGGEGETSCEPDAEVTKLL
jgi:hypothetical protein